jgi:small subunit ribosomal protein S19e
MSGINDKQVEEIIYNTAEQLKKEIKAPAWGAFVKTGAHKQRPPIESDWWTTRAAAVLRKVYLLGPIGTNKLANKYGGRKKRGTKPERHHAGSRSIIRKILQQLEEKGYIQQTEKGVHKGRVITPKGVKLLAGKTNGPGTKQQSARPVANAAANNDTGTQGQATSEQGSN